MLVERLTGGNANHLVVRLRRAALGRPGRRWKILLNERPQQGVLNSGVAAEYRLQAIRADLEFFEIRQRGSLLDQFEQRVHRSVLAEQRLNDSHVRP